MYTIILNDFGLVFYTQLLYYNNIQQITSSRPDLFAHKI